MKRFASHHAPDSIDAPPRRASLLGGAVCLLLTAGAFFGGIEPLAEAHRRNLADQVELAAQHQALAKAMASAGQIRAEVARLQQELEQIPPLEPVGQLNHRLAEIDDLANRHGLRLDDLRPMPTLAGSTFDRRPLIVTGVGSYLACMRFLHELRARQPDLALRGFDLSASSPNSGARGAGHFHFDLEWHAAPDRTAASGQPSPVRNGTNRTNGTNGPVLSATDR